jgi:hypothetical protein
MKGVTQQMDIISNIFTNPQLNFDPLNFIGIIATAIISLYIFKADLPLSSPVSESI